MELLGCNQDGADCSLASTAQPTDCVLGDWGAWSACEDVCDGGAQSSRQRAILTYPTNGGKACDSKLGEIRGCDTSMCKGSTPCQLSPWSSWGECLKCGGQKKRYRTITE